MKALLITMTVLVYAFLMNSGACSAEISEVETRALLQRIHQDAMNEVVKIVLTQGVGDNEGFAQNSPPFYEHENPVMVLLYKEVFKSRQSLHRLYADDGRCFKGYAYIPGRKATLIRTKISEAMKKDETLWTRLFSTLTDDVPKWRNDPARVFIDRQ